jgi:hypothetical protein
MRADPQREQTFSIDVRREYDRATIVGNAFEPKNVDLQAKDEFVRIGRRFYAGQEVFVEEMSNGGTSYSSTIMGIGRSIAIGEEKYFISKLAQAVSVVGVGTKQEMLEKVATSRFTFSAAFMPIDYYSDFHLSPENVGRNGTIQYEDDGRFLIVGERRIPPFWSSKYVEFDRFFFISPNSFEWLVKPDEKTGHRVRITIVPDEAKRKFDVTCETVASMRIIDTGAVLSFKLEQPPTRRSE